MASIRIFVANNPSFGPRADTVGRIHELNLPPEDRSLAEAVSRLKRGEASRADKTEIRAALVAQEQSA